MAEYFPLLDRAVSGLPDPTPEARRSIYERARTALIGQLRTMQPPVAEENIALENQALDDAIARIEARFAVVNPEPARPEARPPVSPGPDVPRSRPALADRPRPSVSRPPAPADARAPRLPTGKAPPIVPPPARERPLPGAVRAAPAPLSDGRPKADAPGPRGSGIRPVMALRPVTTTEGDAAARQAVPDPVAALPPAADLAVPPAGPSDSVPPSRASIQADFDSALDAAARDRDDTAADAARARAASLRPQAPRPVPPRRFGLPAIIAASVIALVMIGVGIAAWRLRDRPDEMAAAHTGAQAPAQQATPGKIIDRAGRPADASPVSHEEAGDDGAAVPAPVGSQTSPGQASQQASPDNAAVQGIPVAQRAALLVDAPDDPQKVKTYPGTVVWHLDSVSPGQGQPLEPAIKADIDIPDAKLKITMLMQKNPEPQLPASHTIEFHFLPQPGNTLGNVKQINVPEMRKDDDSPTGDPLSGVPVAITENYFLVGLSRGAAESQNLRLITERNWVDMSILFAPNKLAKITFEKGPAGQQAIEDAVKGWH